MFSNKWWTRIEDVFLIMDYVCLPEGTSQNINIDTKTAHISKQCHFPRPIIFGYPRFRPTIPIIPTSQPAPGTQGQSTEFRFGSYGLYWTRGRGLMFLRRGGGGGVIKHLAGADEHSWDKNGSFFLLNEEQTGNWVGIVPQKPAIAPFNLAGVLFM